VDWRCGDRGFAAASWLAHGAWDWAHARADGTAVPSWYEDMCQGFDVAVAAPLLLSRTR